jgi:membrane protease YdiL (CAAX protease family)
MTSKQVRIFELVLVLAIGFMPSLIGSIVFVLTGNLNPVIFSHILIDMVKMQAL